MSEEPQLLRIPTDIGRAPPLKNLGYQVDFQDLWPVFLGAGATAVLTFIFITGWQPLPIVLLVFVAIAPVILGHVFVKYLIEGALPHTPDNWYLGVRSLRLSWHHADRHEAPWYMVLVPVFYYEDGIACSPTTEGIVSPLLNMARTMNRLNAGKKKKSGKIKK
jgi:hypothetical protein